MPEIRYVGPHEAVEVDVPGAPGVLERGQTIEVSAELRDRMVKQDGNWEAVKSGEPKNESKPSTGRKEE